MAFLSTFFLASVNDSLAADGRKYRGFSLFYEAIKDGCIKFWYNSLVPVFFPALFAPASRSNLERVLKRFLFTCSVTPVPQLILLTFLTLYRYVSSDHRPSVYLLIFAAIHFLFQISDSPFPSFLIFFYFPRYAPTFSSLFPDRKDCP